MERQVHIVIFFLFICFSCKVDSPSVEPNEIFYWKADNPIGFSRANSIVNFNSDVLSPITVIFDNKNSNGDTDNYNLLLDGGDSLVFMNEGECFYPLKVNDVVSDSRIVSSKISIEYIRNNASICTPLDTFYIGFKRSYNQNLRTTFGWFRVVIPLKGFYQIDKLGWNFANHQPAKVGQRN